MIQAIFYKEWIKTRWYWLLATLFMIGITGYSMLRIGRTIDQYREFESFMGSDGPEGCYIYLICCNLSLYLSVSCLLPYSFSPRCNVSV